MKDVADEVLNWYDKNANLYQRFSKEISNIIERILIANKIPFHSINYRVKEKESYLSKCKKDKYNDPVKEVMDVSGVRIIAYTNKDVNRICEIIKTEFDIDPDNSTNKADVLAEDKVGYLSVHYIAQLNESRSLLLEYKEFKDLKCEIQIRTLLQHAWAEIEHDKNYKFSGELPIDIKRRFHLVAGVLEMMDREFDSLSLEIDEYVNETKKKTLEGNFDIYIDSTSLTEYLATKFIGSNFDEGDKDLMLNKSIIKELQLFGFKKIKDIDDALTLLPSKLLSIDNTYNGLLRDIMMYTDIEYYFNNAYENNWNVIPRSKVNQFIEDKINITDYLKKHDIKIVHEY